MARDQRPIIGVTMGDPAGIGPEVCARAFADESVRRVSQPVLFGDARVMQKAVDLVGASLKVRAIDDPAAATGREDLLEVVSLANAHPAEFLPGQVSALCGRAAWEYIEAAGRAALARNIAAVVTAPINKESIAAAKVPHIGHTEMLGAIAGVADPLTMFETLNLRVFFLTRHVSLRKACDFVTRDRLVDYIERCSDALTDLGLAGPLAIAGLNPHCSEHGLFGDEERKEMEPAIAEAKQRGISVVGPIGADSVFHQAKMGRFAAVLSLYHDQGHIACKTLDFDKTVSITLGLPFLRTSIDHGTAFDIAWKAEASAVSMVEALLAAARYAPVYAGNVGNA
jgi:4-phospho-D-threonate 3-dehydrogenase / 4-phospho-D-erythronate 3-dehydrogenase